ncbi:MAG TPA: class I SAM-dependent methyltransferase [Pseudobdellovibrionaceae bacterium]|jgi:ubiquinone/menaquinone biosynthesis C-methylase UbiE
MNTSIETFLQDFHKKHPGCTPAAFSNGFTKDHKTSYDMVASVLAPSSENQAIVLDLACGDGVLLQRISTAGYKNLNLIGVDMSVGELEAARTRLSSAKVKLLEAKAQSLPLPDNSVDFVLCHMAFMLMDGIENVVSEIHRVLKPGGTFSAVVGGKYEKAPAMDAFLQLLDEALKEESQSWLSNLGDKRTRSEDGLRSLFTKDRFVQSGTVQDFSIRFHDRPENLMDFFMLMYDVAALSPARQVKLGGDLLLKLESLSDEMGKMHHSMGLRQIIFCKGDS